MSTLNTSVQVLTKNKPYYLKTNLGLMNIRGELLYATFSNSGTQRSEFENLNSSSVGNRRIPEYTRCIGVFRASFGTSHDHDIKFVFSKNYII